MPGLYGDTTKAFDYSDNWYADRTILLTKLTERNTKDAANSVLLDDKTYRSNRTYVDFATGKHSPRAATPPMPTWWRPSKSCLATTWTTASSAAMPLPKVKAMHSTAVRVMTTWMERPETTIWKAA